MSVRHMIKSALKLCNWHRTSQFVEQWRETVLPVELLRVGDRRFDQVEWQVAPQLVEQALGAYSADVPGGWVVRDRREQLHRAGLACYVGWMAWTHKRGFAAQRHRRVVQAQRQLGPQTRLRRGAQRLAHVAPAGRELLARGRSAPKDAEVIGPIG